MAIAMPSPPLTLDSPLPSARTTTAAERRAATRCCCGASAARRRQAALLQGRSGCSRAAAAATGRADRWAGSGALHSAATELIVAAELNDQTLSFPATHRDSLAGCFAWPPPSGPLLRALPIHRMLESPISVVDRPLLALIHLCPPAAPGPASQHPVPPPAAPRLRVSATLVTGPLPTPPAMSTVQAAMCTAATVNGAVCSSRGVQRARVAAAGAARPRPAAALRLQRSSSSHVARRQAVCVRAVLNVSDATFEEEVLKVGG